MLWFLSGCRICGLIFYSLTIRLVPNAAEAFVQSAKLGIRTGLGQPLLSYGRIGFFGLAKRPGQYGCQVRINLFSRSTYLQCLLDAAFLWLAVADSCTCRYYSALAGDSRNHYQFLQGLRAGGNSTCPLYTLGQLRCGPECGDLDTKSLTYRSK